MIVELLLKYWKQNIKLIDDLAIIKLVTVMGSTLFSLGFGLLEFVSLQENNLIGVFILLTAVVQYNKNTIIFHITDVKKSSFYVAGKQTFRRFCLFQILKYNIILPFAVLMTVIVSLFMIFIRPFMFIAVWLILGVELFLFWISYRIERRRQYERIGGYATGFAFNCSPGILYSTLAYFTRQPLQEYLEMLAELVLALLMVYLGVSPVVVNYFIIIFCVLDIELYAERNMEQYGKFYGKYAFKRSACVTTARRFLSSNEYRTFLKYLLIECGFVYYGQLTVCWFLVLLFALAYRYFLGCERVLEARTLFRSTIFRACMFYFILITLAPFLFEKEMYKIFDGYRQEYGVVYFIIMSLLLLFLPIERMIKVNGEIVDDNKS
ncbi:MAG: hypothetical protein VZR00_02890 [Lachnospiraceae bacterium]|nr:hypothetical protein [Lachnospiraceae bacterium]MEE3460823.1 hypothetical protein [Lachnospiraceae bacterium]